MIGTTPRFVAYEHETACTLPSGYVIIFEYAKQSLLPSGLVLDDRHEEESRDEAVEETRIGSGADPTPPL